MKKILVMGARDAGKTTLPGPLALYGHPPGPDAGCDLKRIVLPHHAEVIYATGFREQAESFLAKPSREFG